MQSRFMMALLAVLTILLTTAYTFAFQVDEKLRALDGDWVYMEDRTEGRALAQMGPPMSGKFTFRVEEKAVILVSGHGSGHKNVRIALDGSIIEVPDSATGQVARYRGSWKDGVFTSEVDFVRAAGKSPEGLIKREFKYTPDGLVVTFRGSVGLYRHAKDIPMPTAFKAGIGDVGWLAGAWVGTRGAEGAIAFEERWTNPSGGAMLAISRTVARGKMTAFEFLRIVERDGGLVYFAQPGGAPATEFVLSDLSKTRAVFDNPRHDYPKRIMYELSPEGNLTATIGFLKGGTPRKFEFKREATAK